MAVKIRLSRGGAKKRPFYRIVVADARAMRDGGFIERIGHYDPMLPKDREDRVVIDLERAKHWLSVGAQPTDRISKFLEKEGVLEPKTRNNPQKAKPGTKAQERIDAARLKAEEAAQAKADAEAAPAEAEAPVEEAPVEEAPADETPAEEKAAES
ncbi:30S ribosomal protein S16 [Minwuia thermotolerans]|uniref:Small ribosomal subunit protein bS16 n=1 Tax=Minwuia thermotolerans TaxID=2056226 RepID=A0A2M9FXT3_9PROT|nr:30S ribosomal protein S16 [Minwuia thermotolerans]